MTTRKLVFELLHTLLVFTFCIWVVMLVTGCAVSDLTPLERHVRIEQRMRSCMNAGGVWISPQDNMYAGKCDWNRSIF